MNEAKGNCMRKKQFFVPNGWQFKGNFLVGTKWSVPGSKNNVYTVALTEKGFTCECTGFNFHGKCKHSLAVAEQFDV